MAVELVDSQHDWQVRVVALGGNASRAYARNHTIELGRAASFHDRDEHPSAIELLLAALGADLLDGWSGAARRAGMPAHDAEMTLTARLEDPLSHLGTVGAEGSPAIAAITGTLYVNTGADAEACARAWRETLARSPLHATLSRATSITIALTPIA